MKDRQENFIEKGKTLCQEGCAFSKYDTKISKAICSCAPKKYSSSLADVTFDRTKKTLINFQKAKNYDTRKLDNGEYEIKEIEKMKWTLTTLKNEKNHINNKNMTSIDLGNCETSLRNEYNIPGNKELYIKKIEIFEEKMKSFNVEYDVFCKLFGTNLMKLNLIACSNDKILIYIPFIMNGNIDKYNTNSGYYNDICYTTIS